MQSLLPSHQLGFYLADKFQVKSNRTGRPAFAMTRDGGLSEKYGRYLQLRPLEYSYLSAHRFAATGAREPEWPTEWLRHCR